MHHTQGALSRSVRPGAEPGCVSSQASTTVTPVTRVTPPSSRHAWCTTGTSLNERWAQHMQITSYIYTHCTDAVIADAKVAERSFKALKLNIV